MRSNIKLGKLSGIEIGLHYSWFIIAALIVQNEISVGSSAATLRKQQGSGRTGVTFAGDGATHRKKL